MSRDERATGRVGHPLMIEVVHGRPTAAEIAAVTLVLVSLRPPTGASQPAPERSGGWASRRRELRTPVRPGPGAWRMSGRA